MTQAPHLRYQHKPFIGSSHTWALSRCANISTSSRVLDIGCGSGAIGRALKERGIQNIFAVEVDAQARENAAGIYARVGSSLSDFAGQRFDVILLLDVLEHLTNPDAFLKEAIDLLSPGGTMLISVPNIAHWSVRLPLLFGFFKYTQRGILDKTHFQFFTRRRLRRLIKNQGTLKQLRIGASIAPVEFVVPKWLWNTRLFLLMGRMRLVAAQIFPGLLAYQHLAEAKKPL